MIITSNLILVQLIACSDGLGNTDDTGDAGPAGLAVLGQDSHDIANVIVDTMATSSDGLATPRDLAFNPESGDLWIVNRATNNVVVITDPGTDSQAIETIGSTNYGSHFLAQPSSLDFGDNGNFATSHEEDEKTQGANGTPADFMGPTLWPANTDDFDGGHSGHLDMLHNSPNGVGVAWQSDNSFWIFDGYHESVTLYNFHDDHGMGGTSHTDGEIARYAEGDVSYVEDITSNMVVDHDTDLLYVADTGNNRIAVLDTTAGDKGSRIYPNNDGADQYEMDNIDFSTFIDLSEHGLELPSGLELVGGMLWVTDNASSKIYAFDMDGTLVDWLDTELEAGSLMGLALDDAGDIWLLDVEGEEVLRISPGVTDSAE